MFAFYMPSKHSGGDTKMAAEVLANELGVTLQTIPIHDAIEREIEATVEMLGGQQPTELTRQNIQARIRGQRMWNWANTSGALFLQTGDMSEKAVGYTTIGGDLEGALSVIANVPKTVVIALLQRLETRFGFKGVSATLHTDPGSGARRQAGRRERADAVPGPRRVPASLRRREDVAGRGRRGAEGAVPRLSGRHARRTGRRGSPRCSHSRSTSGCSRRSRCTSGRSISIASARCRCRSFNATNGSRTRVRAVRTVRKCLGLSS